MPRRLRRILTVAAACAVLVGCDAAPEPTSGPTAETEPDRPQATAYDDEQLTAALPRTKTQLRVPVTEKCLSLSEACAPTDAAGVAFAQGDDGAVAVRIFHTWDAGAWADRVGDCPRGRYERPLTSTPEYGEGSYRPGERGASRRTNWTVGTWSGFVCQKSLIYLLPKNETSERHRSTYAFLHNGHHLLRVDARTPAETRRLAGEYLKRLERAGT